MKKEAKGSKKVALVTQEAMDSHVSTDEKMLKLFDLTFKYGPCSGMTRLERWDRAESFGLHPPQEVRDLLLSLPKEDRLHQNVWHGML